MTEFTRSSPGMQDLFPSSGRDVPRPREVTDVVHLVHPFPGQMLALETALRQSFTSAAAVSPVIAFAVGTGPATQPQTTYDELIFGHVGHTFAGTSRVRISLIDPAGAAVVAAIFRFDSTVEGFQPLLSPCSENQGSVAFMPHLVIPPGWQLQAFGQTQAVAYTITVAYVAARRPLVDVPLFR